MHTDLIWSVMRVILQIARCDLLSRVNSRSEWSRPNDENSIEFVALAFRLGYRRDLFSNNRRIICRLLFVFSRSTEGFFFVRLNQRYWNAQIEFFGKCDSLGFLDWYDSRVLLSGDVCVQPSGAHDFQLVVHSAVRISPELHRFYLIVTKKKSWTKIINCAKHNLLSSTVFLTNTVERGSENIAKIDYGYAFRTLKVSLYALQYLNDECACVSRERCNFDVAMAVTLACETHVGVRKVKLFYLWSSI